MKPTTPVVRIKENNTAWAAPLGGRLRRLSVDDDSAPPPLALSGGQGSAEHVVGLPQSDATMSVDGFPAPSMLRTPSGILTEIVGRKRQEVDTLLPLKGQFERAAYESVSGRRPFAAALRAHSPSIIAEIKKASPSKGLLQASFQPSSIARAYQAGGAACLSVLTDTRYFQGSLADLQAARAAVDLPVLRKDFTIHPVQIFEAAAHQADAILLIAAILSFEELRDLQALAASLGLAALVEVHDAGELAKAVDSGATVIGVNNRNLETFEVTLETSLGLGPQIPSGVLSVSESGIHSKADLDRLRAVGYSAFLVGESLMRSNDPEAALKVLLQ